MKIYARIYEGSVVEVISIADDLSVSDCFTAEFVATLVDVTAIDVTPEQGWTYDGVLFSPYVEPAPSSAYIVAINSIARDQLLSIAGLAISPLQDAIDLGVATAEEEALLTAWKQYRVGVNRMDLTALSPEWPTPPS